MNTELGRKLASVAFIVGVFLLWEVLCLAFHVSDVILPRPSQVLVTLIEKWPALWPHTVQTLYTTMVGFIGGVIIGVVIGVIVGWSKLAYDVAYPLLVGFSSIPKVAVVPILVLYFGSGTVPAVLTALITCVFPKSGCRLSDKITHNRKNPPTGEAKMLTRLAAFAAALMLSLTPALAQEKVQEKIKFTLDWKLQGLHAWFYWAADKGYFKAEG